VSIGGTVQRLVAPGGGPDIIFETNIRGELIIIIAECKSQGEPQYGWPHNNYASIKRIILPPTLS